MHTCALFACAVDAFTQWSEWGACEGPPSCLESRWRRCLLTVPNANIECERGQTRQDRACLAGAHLGCPVTNGDSALRPLLVYSYFLVICRLVASF